MALPTPRPPSSLFVSPKRLGPRDGTKKPKRQAFVCPTCRSTECTKEDGTLICKLCGSGTIIIQEDAEGGELTYTKGKTMKIVTDLSVKPRDIVTTVQAVLLLQLEVLITEFHCPESLYKCTFHIWKAYLAAETSSAKREKERDNTERTGEIGPYIRDMDRDIDITNISLKLDITLCVLFLACLMLRLPFLSSDFTSWATNGALPFKSATGKLRIENPTVYRLFFRKSQFVPHQSLLLKKTVHLAKLLNLVIPPINAPLVCYRVLSQLSLTILVPYLKPLYTTLPNTFFNYTSTSYNSTESRVISLIPLAFLRYFSSSSSSSSSNTSHSFNNNNTNKLDIGGWMRKYKHAQFKASLYADVPFKGIEEICDASYDTFASVSAKELRRLFEGAPNDRSQSSVTNQTPILHPVNNPPSLLSSLSHSTPSSSTSSSSTTNTIEGMYRVLLHVCANYTNDTSYNLIEQHIEDIEKMLTKNNNTPKSPKSPRSSKSPKSPKSPKRKRSSLSRIEDTQMNEDNNTSFENNISMNENLFVSDDEGENNVNETDNANGTENNYSEFTSNNFYRDLGAG